MTTEPGQYTLQIWQGANLGLLINWKDGSGSNVDLTDYTARMKAGSTVTETSHFINLTTEGGGITIDGPNGNITLSMSAGQTAALNPGAGVYDLEVVSPSGVVTRLLEGTIIISPEVTR